MSELKPCPFCGGEAHINEYDEYGKFQYRVDCSNPECAMGFPDAWYDDRDELVKDWNQRSP